MCRRFSCRPSADNFRLPGDSYNLVSRFAVHHYLVEQNAWRGDSTAANPWKVILLRSPLVLPSVNCRQLIESRTCGRPLTC